MSSSICPHFTQNAWKKDLCSNCFKSKDEHKQAAAAYAAGKSFSFSSNKKPNSSSLVSRSETDHKKTDYPNKYKTPAKSIIKKKSATGKSNKGKPRKVTFPKNLFEVIGYGGEWSDNDESDDDDHDFMNLANERDENAATSTDDEETLDLKRITRANTDFNMNNGNLLGDPQENIKKSFAALKLGAPQVDKEGKKQTLKISVVPFGATAPTGSSGSGSGNDSIKSKVNSSATTKASFATKTETISKLECSSITTTTAAKITNTSIAPATQSQTTAVRSVKKSTPNIASASTTVTTKATSAQTTASTIAVKIEAASDGDGKNSPPIERAMEKSLLDEISETLQQNESKKLSAEKEASAANANKIKFEITSLAETLENKPFLDLKKPIARNPPITKDHAKPKINVFHKFSDTDSNCSDADNGISAYYDVVETQVSYENLPDGKCATKETQSPVTQDQTDNSSSIFTSSQYITDMLLSSKTRAASYNLHEGNFMTSKITSDGLIVTKCSSDDALDSTGSSFDGSSDEETSYNMTRSESDSGIGISIGNDYKNLNLNLNIEKERERQRVEKKLSASTNNSDYEDIQVAEHANVAAKVEVATVLSSPKLRKPTFSLDKSRELHGEPDGSADPDGSLESKEPPAVQPPQLPALPKSPPPTKTIDARPSFLHGLQKQHPPILLKKPDLPAKPIVSPVNSPLKTFTAKRQPTNVEQQVISQLQLVMSRSNDNLVASDATKDDAKFKKGRAPNPPPEQKSSAPPTPERDYNIVLEFAELEKKKQETSAKDAAATVKTEQQQTLNRTQTTADSNKVSEVVAKKSSTVNTEVEKVSEHNGSPSASTTSPPVATITNTPTNIYTRKLAAAAANASNGTKNTASPVIREKDKRERATINPKFRSLNTFVSQRNNAAKNLQPLTPEPTPRNNSKSNNLSMSEECLVPMTDTTAAFVSASNMDLSAISAADKKSPTAPAKTKTKFSIKKFLRMGASKTTDNLHKKEGIYSEICTGEETGVVGKPRLVIIHPIDINPTAVEVVKDITKTNDAVATQTVAVVTTKPPAPPLRVLDGQRAHEINKPARPPPPKSVELRRKQKNGLSANEAQTLGAAIEATSSGGSMKCKADNVYANLGEIRSSIAPRKPERTASMREREAQLELARKRHAGHNNENVDTISICSSNGENVLAEQTQQQQQQQKNSNNNSATTSTLSPQLSISGRNVATDAKPPTGSSRTSTFERKKSDPKIASKLEIFENRATTPTSTTTAITMNSNNSGNNSDSRPSSLKDSVRKINSTIDSYLKDKRDFENMYEFVKTAASPPPPPARTVDLTTAQRGVPPRRGILYSDTASVASYTRSEYGPVRSYGLNNSLANIPRVISASYCGSEMGEFDIYSPYSYYGSEAGGDVATDINDSVWGIPSAIKNRTKATNRLRMRKGRSVVHKTIEDNYTAVVVANHEALAQVLDQLQQTPIIPPALRPLANAINLRFEDFTILDGAQAFVVGKKAFHAALWTNAPVTLALSADSNQLAGVGGELSQLSGGVCGVLNPITEFCDLVPSYHLPLMPSTEVVLLQATISVLPRLQLDTLQSIGAILKGKSQVLDKSNFNFRGSIPNLTGLKDVSVGGTSALRNVVSVQNLSTLNEGECMDKVAENEQPTHGVPAFDDVMTREVAFIMLQLVNGMKNLQVKAIEEMPLSLSNVVLSKDVENKDAQARLCVLQGNNNDEDEPMGTLCKCAHTALSEMLPSTKITPLLADILLKERSESLSKSKSVLEFVLWGPSDVVLSGSCKERELALQRWLDLERATVLHGLVRTRIELTVYDECHLMFLVRSNAKMMNDAAKIVCSYQQQRSEEKE